MAATASELKTLLQSFWHLNHKINLKTGVINPVIVNLKVFQNIPTKFPPEVEDEDEEAAAFPLDEDDSFSLEEAGLCCEICVTPNWAVAVMLIPVVLLLVIDRSELSLDE